MHTATILLLGGLPCCECCFPSAHMDLSHWDWLSQAFGDTTSSLLAIAVAAVSAPERLESVATHAAINLMSHGTCIVREFAEHVSNLLVGALVLASGVTMQALVALTGADDLAHTVCRRGDAGGGATVAAQQAPAGLPLPAEFWLLVRSRPHG